MKVGVVLYFENRTTPLQILDPTLSLMPLAPGCVLRYGDPSGSRCSGRAMRVWPN